MDAQSLKDDDNVMMMNETATAWGVAQSKIALNRSKIAIGIAQSLKAGMSIYILLGGPSAPQLSYPLSLPNPFEKSLVELKEINES